LHFWCVCFSNNYYLIANSRSHSLQASAVTPSVCRSNVFVVSWSSSAEKLLCRLFGDSFGHLQVYTTRSLDAA